MKIHMENSKYLSVGALTKYLKYKFDQDPYLTRVFIKGELSNVKRHTSGHIFFALKDGNAVIRAIMFSRSASGLKFEPEEGQSVLLQGRISIFESSGQYQIYVDSMEIDGIGMLFEQLEKDKKELDGKGYFDAGHKKPLPRYPGTITIISSETSAAYRDMITTLRRRFPLVRVSMINTMMQGRGSRQAVIDSLDYADSLSSDVIILARGGGSIEDLWTFNEKSVSLKVFEMKTPVITGVGHETDTTLVDFVSDVRAATPTAAAEVAVPDTRDIQDNLSSFDTFMMRSMSKKIEFHRNQLESLSNYYKLKNPELLYDQQTEKLATLRMNLDTRVNTILREKRYRQNSIKDKIEYNSPRPMIERFKEILGESKARLDEEMADTVTDRKKQLSSTIELLNSLSPTSILLRGYSFTAKDGNIVRNSETLAPGDEIETTLSDGEITSKVTEVKNNVRK
ncbi:Exodeoxyribonuclease VII large subunit [Salinicoccus halodurans]|uniref:Exodeoxyribonuclease 7 large subunit n=2 Tax=Salinicoccus halodurans TaxID=407035 RepID=A0AA94KUW4_9STAP|nr:Exodeoxyribonuclease VII large subunit [Salinicoccus halodurans]